MFVSIVPIHKIGKTFPSPASFRPISFSSCISKLFESITLSHLFFFLKFISLLSPIPASFCSAWSTLDQVVYFFGPFRMCLIYSRRVLEQSSVVSTFPKLSTLLGSRFISPAYFCKPPFLIYFADSVFSFYF